MLGDPARGLHLFVAAAEAGSFTGAAERTGLTKSAIGKSVSRLEERLRVQLFNRNTRAVTLTDEGMRLLAQCQAMFEELRETEAELIGRAGEPAGRLRVNLPQMLGRERIVPILLDLMRTHARLELSVAFDNRRVDLLDEGYDLTVRLGDLEDSATLAATTLGWQGTLLCAAPSYLAARGTPKTIAGLAGHEPVLETRHNRPLGWPLREHGGAWCEVRLPGRLMLGDPMSVASATHAGFGIALLPAWVADVGLETGTLVRLLPDVETPRLRISAVWPQTRWVSNRHRLAIDALRSGLGRDTASPEAGGV